MPEGSILLVHADEAGRRVWAGALRDAGHQVREAASVSQAWELLAREQPGVLILDLGPESEAGAEMLRRLRADAATASLPVLCLSAACADDLTLAQDLGAGADACLRSPVAPELLSAQVMALLRVRQRQQHLQADQRRIAEALDSLQEGFYALDREWRFTHVNARAAAYWECRPEDLLGRGLWQTFPCLVGTEHEVRHRQAMEGRRPVEYAWRAEDSDASYEVRVSPSAEGISVSWIDASGRKQAEERDAFLIRFSDAMRSLTDPRTVEATTCRMVAEQLGVDQAYWSRVDWETREYVIGDAYTAQGRLRLGGRARLDAWEPFTSMYLEGRSVAVEDLQRETRLLVDVRESLARLGVRASVDVPVTVDGTLRATLTMNHGAPRRWTPGEVKLLEAIAGRAWTELQRAQAEAARRASEERYRELVEDSNSIIMRADCDLTITYMNDFGLRFFGYTAEEVIGKNVIGTTIPERDDEGRDLAAMAREIVTAPERYRTNVHLNMRKGGELVWVSWTNRVQYDQGGQPVGILAVGNDLSQLKQAEEALRASEAEYRHLVEYAPTGIYEMDYAGPRFRRVNEAMCRILGYSQEELLAMNPADLLDEESRRRFGERIRKVLAGEPVDPAVAFRVLPRDGREIWASLNVQPLYRDGKPNGALVVAHDVTERRRAEQERETLLGQVQEQARFLAAFLDNTPTALAYLDTDLRFVRVNSTYAEWSGRPVEQIIGRTHLDIWHMPERMEAMRRVLATGTCERRLEVPVVYPSPRGRPNEHVDYTLFPVHNDAGTVVGLVLSVDDATERVRQRELVLEAERARSKLAEAVGDEIAHRVKNNLAMISGLMRMQLLAEHDPHTAEALRDAISRVRAFATLHEQMYASRTEEADLLVALRGIGRTIETLFPAREQTTILVEGDSFRCHSRVATNLSIIANELITNALKHGGRAADGQHSIRVRLQRGEAGATLSVWNSGPPVGHDFDPSQSPTMGLRLVHDMVVGQYGGRFELVPADGGTLAAVSLPEEGIEADSRPR